MNIHVRGAICAIPISALAPFARVATRMASSRRCASTRAHACQLPSPPLHNTLLFYVILFQGSKHAVSFSAH